MCLCHSICLHSLCLFEVNNNKCFVTEEKSLFKYAMKYA